MLTRRNSHLWVVGLIAGGGAVFGTGAVASEQPGVCTTFTTAAASNPLTLVLPHLPTSECRNVDTDGQITLVLPPFPVDHPVTLTAGLELRTDSNWLLFVYHSRERNDSPLPVAVAAISRQGSDMTRLVRNAPDSALTASATIDQPRNAVRVPGEFIHHLTTRVTTAAAAPLLSETVQLHAHPNPRQQVRFEPAVLFSLAAGRHMQEEWLTDQSATQLR